MSGSVALTVDKLRLAAATYPRLLVLGSSALATLLFVLRLRATSKRKKSKGPYVENLAALANKQYDVVIVGGGTSGCVLAGRLSEDPSIRVLLLEAGGSGTVLPYSRIPSGYGRLLRSEHAFNFETEPQVNAQGQQRYFPRGKMLGGCSSINAQMAQYGAPGDFDEWATLMGDESWGWRSLQKSFQKFERVLPHAEYPEMDGSERGTEGPVRVGYFNYVSEHSKAFLRACEQVGIPLIPDFNTSKGPIGASRVCVFLGFLAVTVTYVDSKGVRVSAESAYLTPEVLARPNLTVAIHATVTKILFDETGPTPRAVGVEFAKSATGPRYSVKARKEVVLSAGAIHSPHILMLSGVGPEKQLKAHGIPVVLDVPAVGANLVDHPVVDMYFKDKKNDSMLPMRNPKSLSDIAILTRSLVQYQIWGTGKLATNIGESAAFVRSDDPKLFPPAEYPRTLADSTSGATSPDLELFCTPLAYKDHGNFTWDFHTYALHCYLVRPESRGAVLLKSADPFALPSVDPNYLANPDDLEKLFRGFRLILKIAHTKALEAYIDHKNTDPTLDHATHTKSDEEIRQIVKERVETVYHPTSTCRMAPVEQGGVVDARLRVYGVEGLRVCDASVFPWIVSGHTAGACLAIGEKFAEELKREIKARK
ncbi:hypothetical protein HMN09_00393200 [Mycena chlorophos]|uniref:Glucose-methanol-choline oxidoreductase N-terminal domain-containing protein n=1 Tax=Mycena chlorophos TaxID=658473 RepID=A0A8H6WGA2_MYCCL|nr:hypothetical protein HMN09_00393200 [Mycena chlorophos]